MEENKKTITTLHNLLDFDALKLASAEFQLKHCMPEWINKATSLKLKTVMQKYFEFVQQHMELLEGFFEEETVNTPFDNHVMQAYIEDTNARLSFCTETGVRDACLLACIQAINHAKICTYGTVATFANALGMEKKAAIFHEAEINEKHIDDRLSQLAEHEINPMAKNPIILPV